MQGVSTAEHKTIFRKGKFDNLISSEIRIYIYVVKLKHKRLNFS